MRFQSIVSPLDQRTTFVELLFDIVFVFSVTQVVGLLHDLSWIHVGQAALVFWLVWRFWSQFTWALNAANTTHPAVEIAVLVATGVAFFMAVAVPDAFESRALAFALPYVAGRAIGLTILGRIASAGALRSANVRVFTLLSVTGLAAVIAGAAIGGVLQYVLWGLVVPLDIFASAIGTRREGWNIRAEHFCERHGLFIIIALGETLIVAAAGLTGRAWTHELLAVALLSVGIAFGLWWTYFTREKPELDLALASCSGIEQSTLARAAFTWGHFPIVCGIIAYAAAVEIAMARPEESLGSGGRIALAASLLLYFGGTGLAFLRATRRLLWKGLTLAIAAAVAVVAITGQAALSFGIVFVALVLIALVERSPSVARRPE